MANRSRLTPRNINQAFRWLLAAVMVPLLLGAFVLLAVQARQEEHLANDHLAALARTLIQAVDRELDYGRGQLEVIAAAPAIDAQDWQELQRFSAEIAGRRAGSHIVLARPDGQLLVNTAVPWGQPLANIWKYDDDDRLVEWEGRRLPLRWKAQSRQVLDGRTVYSDLFFGGTTQRPTLALSVPVVRQGQVRYALTLAFPPELVKRLIDASVEATGMRVLVVDRRGLVVASNAASTVQLADAVAPVAVAPGSSAGHYEITGRDGTRLRAAYAVSSLNGFIVRVALPASEVFSLGQVNSAGWLALVLASLAASILLAGLLGRRLAQPLRELAQIAGSGAPQVDHPATGIAEIDALAHALQLGAQAERRRAEEHVLRIGAQQQQALLEASEERLKRVLDQLFVFVNVLDLEGRLLQSNFAPLDEAGILVEEVIGRPFWECHWWQHPAAETQRVRDAVQRAARGETVRFDTVARFSGPDLLAVDLQLAPLRDEEGRITSLIASSVNIQSRTLALRKLQQSEAAADAARRLLEATLDAAPVGITLADPQGHVLRINRAGAELSGVNPAGDGNRPILSSPPAACVSLAGEPVPLTREEWPLHRALRERVAVTKIVNLTSPDAVAPHATVLMSAAPVLDSRGKTIAGVMVQVDITQRVNAEAALRRADRQKDEFLATLAHELRNPLGPIRSAAELIRLSQPADPRVQRARAIIDRQVSHLARLVDDLLDVSRITLGTIRLRKETLDLAAIAGAAVESTRVTAEGARLQLEQEIEEPHASVSGDATRLLQCVLNLLNNAVKFTPAGGRIVVRVLQEDARAVLEVQDNGNGIAPANLEQIFGLFAQEHPSGTDGNTGLGIGLALTRRLVELHDGSVRAFSAGPGHGSAFRIELPAVSAQAADPAHATAAPDGDGARILIVDDNQDAADLLGEILVMRGFSATSVYSGEAAVTAVKQDSPDAVLLDIGLPDIDGYEVCRRITRAALLKPPHLIALTGWGQDEDLDRTAAAGFSAHLTKPADPDRIIAVLRELLQEKPLKPSASATERLTPARVS